MHSEQQDVIVCDIHLPLSATTRWLRGLGIALVVQGVLSVLSVLGVVLAWLPLWVGILMIKASNCLRAAHDSGDPAQVQAAFDRLRACVMVQGVLMLLAMTITLVVVLFFGGTMVAVILSGNWLT